MKSKIVSTVLISIGFFFGVSALSALAAWTAAPNNPPTCPDTVPGCNAPINVGSLAQTKTGPLTINYSLTDKIALTLGGKIKIVDFNPRIPAENPAGKVLTSDASGVGTWQTRTPTGTIMGYGTGTYIYDTQAKNGCTAIASPFSCSGVNPRCLEGWSVITAGNQYGSCAGSTCSVVYMCVKIETSS